MDTTHSRYGKKGIPNENQHTRDARGVFRPRRARRRPTRKDAQSAARSQKACALRLCGRGPETRAGRPNRISAYIWNADAGEGAGAYFEEPLTAGNACHVFT